MSDQSWPKVRGDWPRSAKGLPTTAAKLHTPERFLGGARRARAEQICDAAGGCPKTCRSNSARPPSEPDFDGAGAATHEVPCRRNT